MLSGLSSTGTLCVVGHVIFLAVHIGSLQVGKLTQARINRLSVIDRGSMTSSGLQAGAALPSGGASGDPLDLLAADAPRALIRAGAPPGGRRDESGFVRGEGGRWVINEEEGEGDGAPARGAGAKRKRRAGGGFDDRASDDSDFDDLRGRAGRAGGAAGASAQSVRSVLSSPAACGDRLAGLMPLPAQCQSAHLSMMALGPQRTSKGAILRTACSSGRTEPASVRQHSTAVTCALQALRRAGPCARPWLHLA
jgi:hypothetical protein